MRTKFRLYRKKFTTGTKIYPICKGCSAPCCKYTRVAITFQEWLKWCHGELNWKLDISYTPQTRLKSPHLKRFYLIKHPLGVDFPLMKGNPITAELKRNSSNECIYQSPSGKCSIYKIRPQACKSWFCGKGETDNFIWRHLIKNEQLMRDRTSGRNMDPES